MKRHQKELLLGMIYENLAELLPSPEIGKNAACNLENAELFFSEDPAKITKAREVCMSCPVRQLCLEHHLRIENDGVAGGLTHLERKKLQKGITVVSLEDVNLAIAIRRDINRLTAECFAEKYDMNIRTYYRIKAEIEQAGVAS